MKHTNDERFDYLTEVMGVSEEAMVMLLNINGDTKKTYDDALYCVCGERDIDDAIDEYNADMED